MNSPICLLRYRTLRMAVLCSVLLTATTSLSAQSLSSGSIRGKVTDETGGALPGVNVTLTSPALLVPQVVMVSDGDGDYRFADLPVGEYSLTYDLSGFQRFVREGIQLTAGFVATVNVNMKVGQVEESLTVTGQSPVVDTTSTTPSVSLSSKTLTEVIPATRTLQEILSTTPGVVPTGRPDLGGGTISGGGYNAYGMSGQLTNLLEGINVRQGANAAGLGPDLASLEEMQIVAVGGSAEQSIPGVYVNMIVKSGGNSFHGRYEGVGENKRFESTNLTPELRAQGITVGDAILSSLDTTGDLGGPVRKDQLWFYGALHYQRTNRTALGYSHAPGPDGTFGTADDVPGSQLSYLDNQTLKGTYQASRAYKFIGFFSRHGELFPERFGSRLIPYENTRKFTWNPHQFKGEMQGMPSNGFLFNVFFGRNRYDANYYAQPDAKNPTSLDNTTQLNLGPNLAQDRRPRSSWQSTGSVSFFPSGEFLGKHELKSGFTYYNQYSGTGQPNGLHGNYQLVFDTINGVRHQPLQIVTYNYPLSPTDRLNEGGVYGQDTWRLGKRTTLNLGLRFDSFHTWVPPQTKEAGQFAEASTFPEVQTGAWRNFAPRLGVVFNVTSDGKTALKATWGRFNHTPGDDFAANFDKNAVTTTTYRWRDLNGNSDYDSGEVDLNTNGPDFLSTSGAAATVFYGTANRNLKEPHTDEGTLTFEREVMANVGARVNYVYSKQVGVFQQVNVLRPYSAYTTQIQRQDPGPDGVIGTADDGGFVTIYDYDPAYRGSAFVANQFQNRPADTFQTIEATLTRRTTDRWGVLASFAGIKNRRHLSAAPASAIIQNPNQDYFPLDTTWNWQGKITGSYQLPWTLNLSGTYQIYNGVLGQRTYIFRNIPVSSTVTIPLEAFGARSGPVRDLLNLRVAKDVSLAAQRRLKLSLELLNALNSSDPWAISYASGPTFGQFTQTNTPRIVRGGVTFSF